MKNIYKNFWVFGLLIPFMMACSPEEAELSSLQTFDPVVATMSGGSTAIVADEVDGAVYTFNFALSANQIVKTTVVAGVGASSTATEGVDFDLLTHDIDLNALEGQDGFSVSLVLYVDSDINEANEDIYLTLTTETPAGLVANEFLLVTINDTGAVPLKADEIDMMLSWSFDDSRLSGADVCGIVYDYDLIINTAFSYSGNLVPDASSLACPETAVLHVSDMVEGQVYNVYVVVWDGVDLGDAALNAMTATVTWARADTEFNGSGSVSGFSSSFSGQGGAIMTIEKNNDLVTMKTLGGAIIDEGKYDLGGIVKLDGITRD